MAHVCAHCGETYPERRPNCPHCGAEADLTWSDDSEAFDDPRMDDRDYADFLDGEGLGEPPRARRGGCALFLLTGFLLLFPLLLLI